ncbi:GlsB/YeaQ/YmgE family stress response membrane protein [Haloechinothrix sp. LS1_15]|uniref:GlsB/YeaQ/YmgE family stress response membrane protein n=1 Tax=Haloechinothrix sp. LS1_15 TaxID=2652248 RepID=UPI0029459AD6|nr:GlsB/YeaQ/YmgE family stress response membrane protein [Haloechinothrix sp. LS1_15]MDV6014412.1 GlsB/YeaQ/YmgE family stress response membrane protein [Haloechinothrix sp. LS1_15]
MGIISWIIFGAIAGWVANVVVGGRNRERRGCILNVLTGVVGAALGGFVYTVGTGRDISFGFDLHSFAVAVLGAILLLLLLQLFSRSGTQRR